MLPHKPLLLRPDNPYANEVHGIMNHAQFPGVLEVRTLSSEESALDTLGLSFCLEFCPEVKLPGSMATHFAVITLIDLSELAASTKRQT